MYDFSTIIIYFQTRKFLRKRKAPAPRSTPVAKKLKFEVAEVLASLQAVEPQPTEGKMSEDTGTAVPMDTGPVQVQGNSDNVSILVIF